MRIRTEEALRDFFAECDAREEGREPEWLEHLEVMTASKLEGEPTSKRRRR
ncbi:MAG TPA: hypothetical protein VNB06_20600 [Thermoanaerobaculia bacterium]|nr:hypothetical protein [Thermoanaerobaculia bacterium]